MQSHVRLDPFDQLMLADARRGYPMCFHMDCAGSGPLDKQRFAAAVQTAALRHPRLRSRIAPGLFGSVWLPPDRDPSVEWIDADRSSAPDPWRPIDLRESSGVRFVGFGCEASEWRIVMTVHHAVCDGLAGAEFWGDAWTAYHGAVPAPFTPGRTPRSSEPGPVGRAPGWLAACREFAALVPAPLRARDHTHQAAPGGEHGFPYATLHLDAQRTALLRAAASDLGGTVNDAVLAATFGAAAEWNRRAGAGAGTRLRILMPASLRAPGERRPAANCMSYAFLDRRLDECQRPAELLASLAAASRWVQETGAAARFLDALAILARLPGALRAATRLPLCMSTVVASWVGNITRRMRAAVPVHDGRLAPGGVTLESFNAAPPIRPGTGMALAMIAYADGLSISALANRRRLGGDADGRFLQLVDEHLETLVTVAAIRCRAPALASPAGD